MPIMKPGYTRTRKLVKLQPVLTVVLHHLSFRVMPIGPVLCLCFSWERSTER
jgi:hypothetical protein